MPKWQEVASDSYQVKSGIHLQDLLQLIHKVEQKTLAYHILQIPNPTSGMWYHSDWNVSSSAPSYMMSSHSMNTQCHNTLLSCITQPIVFTFTSSGRSQPVTRSVVPTAVLLKMQVCWDVMLCATFLTFWSVHGLFLPDSYCMSLLATMLHVWTTGWVG